MNGSEKMPAGTVAGQDPVEIRSAALTLLAGLGVVLALQLAQALVIPVVLGILISYAVDPLVRALQRWHVHRALGAALVLISLVSAGGALIYGLQDEATAVVEQLPEAAQTVRHFLERSRHAGMPAVENVQKAAYEIERAANAAATPPAAPGVTRVQVETPAIDVSRYLVWGSLNAVAAVGQVVLILFLVYFLLASGDLYRRKLVKIAGPSLSKKKVTLQILTEIDLQIERFLLVQACTGVLVGLASWLAFRAIDLHQAGVWGVLAGVFNSIPYFGPVLVTGGIATVALLQFGSLHMVIVAAGLALFITSLEGFLLTPWLTSRAAKMNAVAVFVGLIFWGWVWSVWGMLLAVPMMVVVKAVCDHVEDFRPVGEMIGE